MKTITLLIAIVLTGCVISSTPVPMGGDRYMITHTIKSFVGSSAPAKAEAIRQADAFCKKQGKAMLLTKTVQKDMVMWKSDAMAEVYFKCVATNDPALQSPPPIEEIRQ